MGRKKPHNSYYVVISGRKKGFCASIFCIIIHYFQPGIEKKAYATVAFYQPSHRRFLREYLLIFCRG